MTVVNSPRIIERVVTPLVINNICPLPHKVPVTTPATARDPFAFGGLRRTKAPLRIVLQTVLSRDELVTTGNMTLVGDSLPLTQAVLTLLAAVPYLTPLPTRSEITPPRASPPVPPRTLPYTTNPPKENTFRTVRLLMLYPCRPPTSPWTTEQTSPMPILSLLAGNGLSLGMETLKPRWSTLNKATPTTALLLCEWTMHFPVVDPWTTLIGNSRTGVQWGCLSEGDLHYPSSLRVRQSAPVLPLLTEAWEEWHKRASVPSKLPLGRQKCNSPRESLEPIKLATGLEVGTEEQTLNLTLGPL